MTKYKMSGKSQIPISKSQINPKSQFPKSHPPRILADWLLVIWLLIIIWNLVFGYWNFSFAQDKIIAVVNNDVITQKDLGDFINFMRMQLSEQYKGRGLESKIQAMKLDLMDKLVEDRLILQEAKRVLEEARKNKSMAIISQLDVEDNRVKAKISELRKRYASDKEFQEAIGEQGLSQADIESKIKEQLLMYNIIELKVRRKIVVNPAEVTDFYEKNQEEFITAEERETTLVTVNDESLSRQVYEGLKGSSDLEGLVSKYSLKTDKLTVRRNKELREDIEEAVFKLKSGEVSLPIKVEDSFYIFRLDNIVVPKQENLSEVQDRIYAFLFDAKMQEELTKWLEGLRQEAYIKILPD